MRTAPNRSIKSKVTVCLDPELLKRIDKLTPKGYSRSQIFEKALRKLITEFTRYQVEEEVKRYYTAQSESERAEDREWNKVASESAKKFWEEE